MRKASKVLLIIATLVLIIPSDATPSSLASSLATVPIPLATFENHQYVLHTVDEQGRYYYVAHSVRIHRYSPETESWELDLFKLSSTSSITIVHVTSNNYIFVGLKNGTLYRSIDDGTTFTITQQWANGGYCHRAWSIASDEKWILIGEYGPKNTTRRVCASNDWGNTWQTVYETPEREGAHIHLVTIDSHTGNGIPGTGDWWITVGDYPIGRVIYSDDHGQQWTELKVPKTNRVWQAWQPCNILFFKEFILLFNEPHPQVFKVDRTTMKAEYIADIGDLPDYAPVYSVVAGEYGIYASVVRYLDHTHDAGIFVSYDAYKWHRLFNFTEWASKIDPSIDPANIFGANPLIYVDGYVHARWEVGGGQSNRKNPIDGGLAFKFRDRVYVPETQRYDVIWGRNTYPIIIYSNSIVTHFHFNQIKNQIRFNVVGNPETDYCYVVIPRTVINSIWKITVNGVSPTNFIIFEHPSYNMFSFTKLPSSISHIMIHGTLVLFSNPISNFIMIPVLFGLVIIPIVLKKQSKNPYKPKKL